MKFRITTLLALVVLVLLMFQGMIVAEDEEVAGTAILIADSGMFDVNDAGEKIVTFEGVSQFLSIFVAPMSTGRDFTADFAGSWEAFDGELTAPGIVNVEGKTFELVLTEPSYVFDEDTQTVVSVTFTYTLEKVLSFVETTEAGAVVVEVEELDIKDLEEDAELAAFDTATLFIILDGAFLDDLAVGRETYMLGRRLGGSSSTCPNPLVSSCR